MGCRRLHSTTSRLACAATTSILILTNISSSYAAGVVHLDRQAVVPVGAGAMLQLRVPFGGTAPAGDQVSIALTGGPVWRNEGPAPISAHPIFRISAIELGLSLWSTRSEIRGDRSHERNTHTDLRRRRCRRRRRRNKPETQHRLHALLDWNGCSGCRRGSCHGGLRARQPELGAVTGSTAQSDGRCRFLGGKL